MKTLATCRTPTSASSSTLADAYDVKLPRSSS